jgi:hypothetical protein
MNEFNIEWNGVIAYINIVFIASDPVGVSTTTSTLLTSTYTTSSNTTSATVLGNFYMEPFITVQINSITGGSSASMTVSNASTQQGLTISRTFAAADYITIDSANKQLIVNGAAVDYTGVFPTFYSGEQSLGYTDTFTTRSVVVTVEYRARYV